MHPTKISLHDDTKSVGSIRWIQTSDQLHRLATVASLSGQDFWWTVGYRSDHWHPMYTECSCAALAASRFLRGPQERLNGLKLGQALTFKAKLMGTKDIHLVRLRCSGRPWCTNHCPKRVQALSPHLHHRHRSQDLVVWPRASPKSWAKWWNTSSNTCFMSPWIQKHFPFKSHQPINILGAVKEMPGVR